MTRKARKTHAGFLKQLSTINTDVEIMSEYVAAHKHVVARCLIDGHIWNVTPNNLIKGRRCPKCSNCLKVTQEMFVQKVQKINPSIEVVGCYVNSTTKIKFVCKVDGHEWFTSPSVILSGCGCPLCGKKVKRTNDDFVREVNYKCAELVLLSEYTNSATKIDCKCLLCLHTWSAHPYRLLMGKGCPECAKARLRELARSRALSFQIIKDAFGNRGIRLLTSEDEYVCASKTKLRFLCDKHGEQAIYWSSFRVGCGCVQCGYERGGEFQRTSFDIVKTGFEKAGYHLISTSDCYKNSRSKLTYLCNNHGEQQISWATFKSGGRCPECNTPNNQSRIAVELKALCKTKYPSTIFEYKVLKNPTTNHWLPYDIYIPELNAFVEVMGWQHYRAGSRFHKTSDEFYKQYERDNTKEEYARSNGRYVEIDTRTIIDVEDAMRLVEHGLSATSNMAILLLDDEILERTPMPLDAQTC